MQRNLINLRIGILAVILIFGSMLLIDTDKPVDTFPTSKDAMDYLPLGSSRMTGAAVAAENAMLIELMSTGGQGSAGTMGAERTVVNATLRIWDDTDTQTKYNNSMINFYANYSNSTSGEPINGTIGWCSIAFNYTGTWDDPAWLLSWDESSHLYWYNETIPSRFSSYYNISCTDGASNFATVDVVDEVFVSNSPPTTPTQFYPSSGIFADEINFTCNGSTDLEGDNLTYNIVASIINETLESETRVLVTNLTNSTTSYLWNVTNLTSQVTYVRCRAYDGYNLSTYSENSLIIDRVPNATASIQNLSWLEDTIDTSINLTQYFTDIDGDDLNYTYAGASNIGVSINNDTGIVSLSPNADFYGNDSVIFYAWDHVGANASSNNVTLSVINTPEVNLSSPADGSSGYYASTGIDFYLQVEDDFLIDNCSLYIDGSLNQTKTDLGLNTSLMAYNDSGNIGGLGQGNIINFSGTIITEQLNLTQNYTGFKAYMGQNNGVGPVIVRINGYNLFNITSSDVVASGGWVNKVITNNSILLMNQLNNISFEDRGHSVTTNEFYLYDDAAGATLGEYLVRFTNNILAFNTTTLRKGTYSWNATCYNNQGQSSWSAETWSLTVNNSAPEEPTIVSPTSGTFSNDINISCNGTDADGDNLTYTLRYRKFSAAGIDTIVSNDADGDYMWDVSQIPADNIKLMCYTSDGIDTSSEYEQSGFPITISHTGAPSIPTSLTCNNGPCANQTFTDEINLNCSGSVDTDSPFNYTFGGYYIDYNGLQWYTISSVVNESDYGNYMWNTKVIINQSNISIKCYADDGINTQSSSITADNITITHPNAPTTPINFNYSTDFKYQVNITANLSTDPNGDDILFRIWAYYDSSWHLINDTLTNETVFYWNISSVSEQDIELKAQATDGTYYSNFITAPTLVIAREPTIPTNLTPESGNYEYEINYSCSGSNNTQYFVYYVDAYYDNAWNSLTEAFPGIPPVNDTELAYDDGSYDSIVAQPATSIRWRNFEINTSNGNFSYCVNGYGTGSAPVFRLYWNCDPDGSGCSNSADTGLATSDATYCEDIELTKAGQKYLRIYTTSLSEISTYFDHAYLTAKPFTWNVAGETRQTGVDLRCRANDPAGNSSWFNPSGNLSINRIPTWNSNYQTSFSSPASTYEWNLSEIFYDVDNDFLNFTSTGTACITTEVNNSNITITQNCGCGSGTQIFNIMADDNITITTQQISMVFSDCTGTGGGGGGVSAGEEVIIIQEIQEIEEAEEVVIDEGEEEEEEEPPIPLSPEETGKRRRDEITKDIINKRFSLNRHMIATHGRTQITETVANIDLFVLEDVRVRITIPKDIIESTDDIIVVTPFLIMEKDPVIEFDVGDIQPYEEIEVVYVLNNEITENKFERIIVEVISKELSEEKRARREKEIRDKIEETIKVLDIKREIEIDEETTTYTLDIEFKEELVLYNVSIFEEIPKCLIEIIEEELIDSDFEFEIVNADPLIVWHFDKLTKDQRIQYTIKQFTEKDCADKAKAVPLAQQIILITQRYSPRKAGLSLIPIPIILLVLIFFSKFGEGKRHEEEYINKLTKYAKAEYKLGRTEGEVKKTLTDHGHREEYVSQAITLNTRNRLHHWLVRLEIGLEELILLFIIGLSILDFLEILPGDLDFLKKVISWVILGYLIFRVSPTNILFGHKSKCVDLGLIIGYFALIMKNLVNFTRNFDVTSEVYHLRDLFLYINRHEVLFESSFFIGGIVLLIILSIYIALRFEIKQPSMMALLHVTGHMHKKKEFITRFIISHLLVIGFFIVVFNLLTEWLAIAVDAPIITAAIFFWIFVLVKHKNRFKPIEIIYKIGNVGEKFYEKFIDLFHYKKTLLLGLAGMKLLHLVTDIGNFLIPYTTGLTDAIYFGSLGSGHNALFSLFNGASLFNVEIVGMSILFRIALALGYIANIIALLILLALPALLWYHMYKYRELPVSKVTIFKLSRGTIALFFSTITVFFIAPAFKIGHIKGDGLAGVDITTHSIAGFPALELLLLVAFFVGIITYMLCHTKIRRYLKRIVIVSALTFLGYYMWHYFANVVIYFVDKITLLLEAKPFITAYLIAFLFVNIIFYLVGLASYFVELFLRNELGFKAFVEREWLGILSHHDMHHIHYSNAHDEDKHGQEIEALMKFIENEVAHSSNPIKTIDKLAHHSWNLNTIEEAVKQANIDDVHKQDMLNYVAERKEKIRPLIEYIRRYKDMAPIKAVLRKAVKSGWSVEDIRLAEKEV